MVAYKWKQCFSHEIEKEIKNMGPISDYQVNVFERNQSWYVAINIEK